MILPLGVTKVKYFLILLLKNENLSFFVVKKHLNASFWNKCDACFPDGFLPAVILLLWWVNGTAEHHHTFYDKWRQHLFGLTRLMRTISVAAATSQTDYSEQ